MREKTAKEIGENIILNPRMILWNYYGPYHITLKEINKCDNMAQILDEIHAKIIGTIAFAYLCKLINGKEVIVLCNRIDISGEIFLNMDIEAITKNMNYLLQMYKYLDTIVLTTSQTQTLEDFKKILEDSIQEKKIKKLRRLCKKKSEEKLWKEFKDYIGSYMDYFRLKFILPEDHDIRFKENPYSLIIKDYEKTQKIGLNTVLKDLITSVLDMPIEAENYYRYQEEYVKTQCLKTLYQNDIQSPETYEKMAILQHIFSTFKTAARQKKSSSYVGLNDTSIIEYIANNLDDAKIIPLLNCQVEL